MDAAGDGVRQLRGRGTSAGLTRDEILRVAGEIPPHGLTMKAVADRLGVDRKALHHHVRSVEDLRRTLARGVFDTRIAQAASTPVGTDWRSALRSWGTSIRDACLATGELIEYLRFHHVVDDPRLERVDDLLSLLDDAGFSQVQAGRALLMVATVSNDSARQQLSGLDRSQDQTAHIARVLSEHPQARMERLRKLSASGAVVHGEKQFEWQLDVMMAGLESQLRAGEATADRAD